MNTTTADQDALRQEDAKTSTLIFRTSLVIMGVCIVLFGLNSLLVGSVNFNIRMGITILLCGFSILLIRLNQIKIARHFLTGLPWFVMLILPFWLGDHMAEHDMVYYPYVAIALSLLCSLFFDPGRHVLSFWFWISMYAFTMIMIDRMIFAYSGLQETAVVYDYYAIYKIPQIGIFLFLNLVFYNLIKANRSFEDRLRIKNEKLEEDRQQLKAQSEEISSQNQMLEEQKVEIERINGELEKALDKRTSEVKTQKGQIMEYSFLNAHEVRGPLSRLLGLVDLIEGGFADEDQTEFILANIKKSAIEIDEKIREMNEVLNERRPEDDGFISGTMHKKDPFN